MKISPLSRFLLPIALTIAALPATAQEPSPALDPDPTDPTIITPDTRTYRYQCAGGQTFDVEYSLELATIVLESETLRLTQTPAASGARYSDGTVTLYTKGEEAFVEMGDHIIYEDCVGEPIAVSEMHGAAHEGVMAEPIVQPITFVCDDNLTFQVEFTPDQATLIRADETLTLMQIPAASGAQYSDGQTLLATRGDAAFVEVEGEMVYENCLAQADPVEAEESAVERSDAQTPTQPSIETTTQTPQATVEPAPAPAMSSPPPNSAPPTPVRALW
ncbi:MliC family protein [Egbenema bharatensis]|uniref:MliC family protein n=1 Tax=Egbenema bharatensis TaxID=3463334 RepID=UPI003A8A7D1F